jgi:hypothetical protein
MRASAKLIGENPKYKALLCRFQTISVLGGGDHTAWSINDEIQIRVLTIQLISEHPAAVPLWLWEAEHVTKHSRCHNQCA